MLIFKVFIWLSLVVSHLISWVTYLVNYLSQLQSQRLTEWDIKCVELNEQLRYDWQSHGRQPGRVLRTEKYLNSHNNTRHAMSNAVPTNTTDL